MTLDDLPVTLEEARKTRYWKWGAFPNGRAYQPSRCAFEVYHNERGAIPDQCWRKPGKGPGGLYCAQHGRVMEAHLKSTLG